MSQPRTGSQHQHHLLIRLSHSRGLRRTHSVGFALLTFRGLSPLSWSERQRLLGYFDGSSQRCLRLRQTFSSHMFRITDDYLPDERHHLCLLKISDLMFAGGLMYTIDHSYCADCHTIDNHEGQEAYSQTDTSCSLPDLWRGTGGKVPTHHGTAPHRTSSRPALDCRGLSIEPKLRAFPSSARLAQAANPPRPQ